MDFKQLLKSWLLIALGVLIASNLFAGIRYDDTGSLVVAVLLLSLCNLFLKPLLMLFALPFIILTFGLGIWLINAVLFLLVGQVVNGFSVDSFGHALAGAFIVSLTGAAASVLFGQSRVEVRTHGGTRRGEGPGVALSDSDPQRRRVDKKEDDDVIDV